VKRTPAGGLIGALLALLVAGLAVITVLTALTDGASLAVTAKPARRPVILIGISGLRWNDISRQATPAIWGLAARGAVASLVTTSVHAVTCPDDAWLTLNTGARAAAEKPGATPRCPPLAVQAVAPGHARIPAMQSVVAYNGTTGYESASAWGTLARASGQGQCAAAIGRGAALALASRDGDVGDYQPTLPPDGPALRRDLTRCPLTVIDLGVLPVSKIREARLAAADRSVAAIIAAAPRDSIVVVAGMGDNDSPHLRVIVVSGHGYSQGQLTSASTRQPALVAITDLTPSVFFWLDEPVPVGLTGSMVRSEPRGSLPAAITSMIGQDTANQVYRSITGWFFLYYAVAEVVIFAAIAFAFRGEDERRKRRRVAWYTGAAAVGAAVPAGTFLAGLVPWGQFAHPALWLYGLGFLWAALIGACALAGPWRKAPFGPPGFVCAVTVAVIGVDVITGSRLQLGAPFGLSLVEAGRFYGIGNNALGVYAVAAMLAAAWAGTAGTTRRARVAAAGVVALVAVIAAGWPGFGAKVGGTIAMVPAFLVLLAAIAGIRITWRRGLLIAVSGLVLVAAFAVLDYLVPAIGPSHLGGFVGQIRHGGAGGTIQRKISSNLHSLTVTWYAPAVPAVAIVTGLMLAWPARMRLRTFVSASRINPLLRPALFTVWLAAVLGWLADDSGVSVAAAALPVALPLAIALVVRSANQTAGERTATSRANLCPSGAIGG